MKRLMHLLMLSVLVASVSVTGSVFAQGNNSGDSGGSGFRLSPTRDQLTVQRGATITALVKVRNVSATSQPARAVVDDFSADEEESGNPKLLLGNLAVDNYKYSIKPFVLAIDDIVLEPGEEREVLVTFSIPENTAPGSYYGLLRFVAIEDAGSDTDTAVSLTASVGTIFLIDVPGETIDLLNVAGISVVKDGSSSSIFSSAPDLIATRIRNEGNTFQAPFGKVLVKNWSGDVVQEFEFNKAVPAGNVLPDSIRRFEDGLENIGSFGRYTIEANLSYGDSGGNIITATTTFWVVPWTMLGTVAIGIILVVFAGTRGLKAYNKRVIEQSKGTKVKKK